MKTICVVDLIQEITIAQINHNSKIDWIELNETSQKLLFRDKKMRYEYWWKRNISNLLKEKLTPQIVPCRHCERKEAVTPTEGIFRAMGDSK